MPANRRSLAVACLGIVALIYATIGAIAASSSITPPQIQDLKLTPGVVRPDLTLDQIFHTAWGKDERMVTADMKAQVAKAYGMSAAACPSGKIEIDHLISRELGGADDIRNLWPECYEPAPPAPKLNPVWGAHKKDRLENELHKEACAGTITLDQARAALVDDWRKAYVARWGQPGPGAK